MCRNKSSQPTNPLRIAGVFISIFFVLAGTSSTSTDSGAYPKMLKEPTRTVSAYGPLYYLNDKQPPTEWFQEFEFYFDEQSYGEIVCVRWEFNANGPWQTLPSNGFQRSNADDHLGETFEVRAVVQYYLAGQIETESSNELTIGIGEPLGVQQGTHPGTYYGACN